MTRPTRQVDPAKPDKKPVDFCFFFTKTTPFWIFFKIKIDPTEPIKTQNQSLELNRV
jgi:hypothetical protein